MILLAETGASISCHTYETPAIPNPMYEAVGQSVSDVAPIAGINAIAAPRKKVPVNASPFKISPL